MKWRRIWDTSEQMKLKHCMTWARVLRIRLLRSIPAVFSGDAAALSAAILANGFQGQHKSMANITKSTSFSWWRSATSFPPCFIGAPPPSYLQRIQSHLENSISLPNVYFKNSKASQHQTFPHGLYFWASSSNLRSKASFCCRFKQICIKIKINSLAV